MKLNKIEKLLMNNPIRAFIQRNYESPLLKILGGNHINFNRALEMGCGRGVGTKILFEYFKCNSVTAFDLDEDMVEKARSNLIQYQQKLKLYVADATQIPEQNESFEVVFDFGIIHHIPNPVNPLNTDNLR
jgi:trans-aconitate methyltransferase